MVPTIGTAPLKLGEGHADGELATNEPPTEYQYFVHVHREGDLWYEEGSHN